MAKVTTTFVSDEKDVIDAIAKMNADMSKLRDQNKKLAEDSKKGQQEATGAINQGITAMTKMAASYLSAATAVQVLNAALRDKYEIEKKALELQVRAAPSQRDFIANLGVTTPTQRQEALRSLEGISKRTGVGVSSLYSPGSAALSAAGGIDNMSVAMNALEKAAQIAPDSADKMQAIAGAIIDLNKATGSVQGSKGLDLLVGLQAGSRVKDIGLLATNAPKGIIGASASGFSPEAAAGLYESLSNAMGDQQGASTSTAMSALAGRLRDFVPEEDTFTGTGRHRKIKHKGYGPMSGEARMDLVANDENLRTAFLDSLEQGDSKPFVEKLLTPGSRENKLFKDSTSRYRGMKSGTAESFIAGLNDTDLQSTANMNRGGAAVAENMELANPELSRPPAIRENIERLQEQLGYGLPRRKIDSMWQAGRVLAGDDAISAGLTILRHMEHEQASRATGWSKSWMTREMVAGADNEQLAAVREQIEILRRMEKNQRAGNPNINTEGR